MGVQYHLVWSDSLLSHLPSLGTGGSVPCTPRCRLLLDPVLRLLRRNSSVNRGSSFGAPGLRCAPPRSHTLIPTHAQHTSCRAEVCKAYAPPNFSLWCGATWPFALRLSTLFVMNETLLLGWLMLVAMLVVLMCGVLMFELVGRRRGDLLYQRRLVGGLRRRARRACFPRHHLAHCARGCLGRRLRVCGLAMCEPWRRPLLA